MANVLTPALIKLPPIFDSIAMTMGMPLQLPDRPKARQLEWSDLAAFPYFNAALKESMRLHPVAATGSFRYVTEFARRKLVQRLTSCTLISTNILAYWTVQCSGCMDSNSSITSGLTLPLVQSAGSCEC